MVIKMNSPQRPTTEVNEANEAVSSSPEVAETSPEAADPLRGVRSGSGVSKAKSTELEFSRLKHLVPSISKKSSVSKLDVILEAIRYIDQLQDQLIDQIQEQRLNPAAAADLIVGKENTNTDLLARLQKHK
jgi:hypothetical protein